MDMPEAAMIEYPDDGPTVFGHSWTIETPSPM
jgi:hypothetical protein